MASGNAQFRRKRKITESMVFRKKPEMIWAGVIGCLGSSDSDDRLSGSFYTCMSVRKRRCSADVQKSDEADARHDCSGKDVFSRPATGNDPMKPVFGLWMECAKHKNRELFLTVVYRTI